MNPSITPEVSVVIATYNMGRHVGQAVESVLAQDASLEVIVVDDGSTDDTTAALETFREDPRVRVIRQENQGQPKAKNAGVRACQGRFIAFCDADDYWLPDKLARQLPLFEQDPRVGVVFSMISMLREDGTIHTPVHHLVKGDVLAAMFVRNRVPFGTAVVRREAIEGVGGFDERIPMGIDWDLWLRIAVDWHFDYVAEPTYMYRIWPGQMSHNWRGRYDCALEIMERFLATHPGRVPQDVIDTAYADTYTSLAGKHLRNSGLVPCVRDLCRALQHRANYRPAWRLLIGIPYYYFRARRAS